MSLLENGRRFATIMCADIVGFSRLMEINEADTLSRLINLRSSLIEPCVASHDGEIFKHTGDGFLALFESAGEALRCALEIHSTAISQALRLPASDRLVLRTSLNCCNILVRNGDVFGDGVNIAARLQAYAEPGDVIATADYIDHAREHLGSLSVVDHGVLTLKNISRPVQAFGIRIGSIDQLSAFAPSIQRSKPSIAVLPFRDLSVTRGTSLLADGVCEEITQALAANPDLFVISRSSTRSRKTKEVSLLEIGQQLGVDYVFEGYTDHTNDRLRIGMKLTETGTGHVLRADRFEGLMSERFDLQIKVAHAAVQAFVPNILDWEFRRTVRKHPDSMTAYDLVLQSLSHLYRLSQDSQSAARGLLQQALALDSSFAPAFTYTAYWHVFRVGEGWSPDPDADAREAARAALQAVSHDPNDALALALYGHVKAFLLRDFPAADALLERAVQVGPNCALAWSMSSVTRGYMGDGGGAVARAERGVALSPTDAHAFWNQGMLAQAHYVNGDYEAATAWARRAAAHNPLAKFNLRTLAASLAASGRIIEAGRVVQESLSLDPNFCLTEYLKRCPFEGRLLAIWTSHLRTAGYPEGKSIAYVQGGRT